MRGMNFVTITDHDSIAGVSELLPREDVIIGEELTCYFPEDHCKIHLLVWGISAQDHTTLQSVAQDIYQVAQYVAAQKLAHAVAHPLYRQNGKLSRWHIERLLLLFKGFECLNGAHSTLHRDAFERQLATLDEKAIGQMERVHDLAALYETPWAKARTAGSDDHGLFNIGRTWTEFPADVRSVADVLNCLCEGRCRPGGEAGSSIKLRHNFYGVGIRYYLNQLAPRRSVAACFGGRLVGTQSKGRLVMARAAARHLAGGVVNKTRDLLAFPSAAARDGALEPIAHSVAAVTDGGASGDWRSAAGRAGALSEHEAMFALMSSLMRDVSGGITRAAVEAAREGRLGEIFDAVSAVAAQQALFLPYYFALFHQNQERQLLPRLTGSEAGTDRISLRVGLFLDAIEGDGAAVAARGMRHDLPMIEGSIGPF